MKVLLSLVWYFSKSSYWWMFLPEHMAGCWVLTPCWGGSHCGLLVWNACSLLSQALTVWLLSAVSWLLLAPTPEHLCSRALCDDGMF